MNKKPLQRFGYQDSPYHRPNQDWVCGYTDSGQACPRGPEASGKCSGAGHCEPLQQEGRWKCTRSDLAGGPCNDGPTSDGRCGVALPPCQPRRSLRAKRRLVSRWITAITVGLLMVVLGGQQGLALLEPGPRVSGHAQLQACDACHESADHPMSSWLGRVFSGHAGATDSQRCLLCHGVGEAPELAHGLSAQQREALAPAQPMAGAGLKVRWASELLVDPTAPLDCGQCHREHRGTQADISAMSNARCQTCHTQQFNSFADGHPDFEDFPARRRTRIQFDHVAHIGKHFADAPEGAVVPEACGDCHMPANAQGMMVMRGFDAGCAGCHAGDIAGAGRADAPGVAILQVPGFDVQALHNAGMVTGQWPEFAEGRGSAFLESLLQADPTAHAAYQRLRDADDWLDLSSAPLETLQAAQTVIWAYKRFMLDLREQGASALVQRLIGDSDRAAERQMRQLVSGLSIHVIEATSDAWFPDLAAEWAAYVAGELPVPEVVAPVITASSVEADFDEDEFADLFGDSGDLFASDETETEIAAEPVRPISDGIPAPVIPDSVPAMPSSKPQATPQPVEQASVHTEAVDDDEFDALFGGDDLFSSDVELDEDDTASPVEKKSVALSLDERMRLGGWYLDDLSLRYRPAGHADALLQAWLQQAAAPQVVTALADPGSPGRCTKCHSADRANESEQLRINWHVARPDPHQHAFTEFNHKAHFSIMGDAGCMGCHQLNAEADYAAAFAGTDARVFASNFRNLERNKCATCHTGGQAGDQCTTCHSYHIGEFAATEPLTRLTKALSGSP